MRRAFLALTVVVVAIAASLALAENIEDGMISWRAGDFPAALRIWKALADKGDAVAQFNVGFMHQDGLGTPRNHAEAAKWYRRAAEQGHITAQTTLAFLYEAGLGVPQDLAIAHMWWNLAVAASPANSSERTIYIMGRENLESKMSAAQIADAQRLAREWFAQRK